MRQARNAVHLIRSLAALAAILLAWSPAHAQDRIAIVGVTVIDGTGAPPRPGMTVEIEDGRIRAVARRAVPPTNARVIDGRGKYLLPGFIDSNVHGTVYGNPARRDTSAKYSERNEELALEFAQRHLKVGVTTIRDSYGVLPPLLRVRDRIARGEAIGPRLLVAGNIIGWGGPFSRTYSLTDDSELSLFQEQWNDLLSQGVGEELMDMTPEELRTAIRTYLDKGVDFLKYGGTSHFMRPSLIGFSPRAQRIIVEEGHKRGKVVETHATSSEGLRLAVEAGIDLIQHPELMSRDLPADLVELIVNRGTLCAMRANMVTGDVRRRQLERRSAAAARLADAAPPETSAERHRRAEALGEEAEIQRRNAERLIRAGCRITIATDNYLGDAPEFRRQPKPPEQEPGEGSLRAIEGLTELGMTPMQAIVAATRNGAAAAGMEKDLGTIEAGKIADLILLKADPLADIRNIRSLDLVIASGRVVPIDRLPDQAFFGPPATTSTP
ncbi:amidohydrolase family protein [Sphingosinicella sp. CPCC 101087]|uniref:amidohydrolase family protein n=1 Tax=Sphingosinicella sp. CPCC 101087 TaxID=2497754 RepID=UPI00101E1408|nr:amidohydrolase family protein [Sphingosinicella sp. CPCC 101087]